MKMKNKTTLLAVATLATLAIANNVKADSQDSPVSSPEASELVSTTAVENNTTAPENATESSTKAPTTITKEGTEITVTNPEVVVDQSNGTGKYQPFTVEYKNIHFDDNMAINEGDKVKFTLPEEVKFQTSFDFDVYNPDKQVVGKATTDAENNTVTTVFNNYFASHPLNKQMSLKLDATWTDKVQSGKPVTANFNGTLVTATIGKEQVIGKDELLSKWGSQDKDDPTVINWTARVNYAKRVLNYVTIIDEMSENQKLVDNFFEVKNIESVDPWIDKGDAMNLVKSISKSEHGFTITMDRLDHMIYINYKTKLTKPVKESFNPTNKIEIKAESDGGISHSYVQLVGGKGNASGENKPEPTWEIPNDAPKYEKPEWHGGIPGIPEERVKPEYTEPIGTIPNDAPILDKPEINIEDIPMMPPAPILEKPYLPIEDVPVLPPAPIVEIPELIIPEEPVKPQEPNKPSEPKPQEPIKPQDPKPQEPKEVVEIKNTGSEEPIKSYDAPAVLPATGSDFGIAVSLLGMLGLMVGIKFKKEN